MYTGIVSIKLEAKESDTEIGIAAYDSCSGGSTQGSIFLEPLTSWLTTPGWADYTWKLYRDVQSFKRSAFECLPGLGSLKHF